MNYQHLFYFWTVAREGGLVKAGRVLHLTHPTLSSQIHSLEGYFGQKLFTRTGRSLSLTEAGRTVYRYASEIFSLGKELQGVLAQHEISGVMRLDVGVSDIVPKMIVRELLQPALHLKTPVRLVCHEDSHNTLLAELALHTLDIMIADSPVPTGSHIKAFTHLLGESSLSIFGTDSLAKTYRRNFPRSLDKAPFLLPSGDMSLRRSLDQWFDSIGTHPRVIAEFDDSALLKAFGAEGVGLFAAPTVVSKEICHQFNVKVIGQIPVITERYYALTVERRIKNPAAIAITEAARNRLFI